MDRTDNPNRENVMRWILLQLHAPMASFGGVAIDSHGITREFPGQSLLVGLFANALGWTRTMDWKHQALQERMIFGVIYENDAEHHLITDYQTVELRKNDKSWSTRGHSIGRDGGPKTYRGAHQRWRQYLNDIRFLSVVRLNDSKVNPTIDDLANAIQFPARPLFIGRKSCLPSGPIFRGWVHASNAVDALRSTIETENSRPKGMWPASENTIDLVRNTTIADERNWITGLHGGSRQICEGRLSKMRIKS